MADLRISELAALAGSNLAAGDLLPIADLSASETKKITVTDFTGKAITLIADATIPGAKILFGTSQVPGTALIDAGVTTAKIADDAVTAAKLGDESTVNLVTTLPAVGAFVGQLALDTDDYKVYCWDGTVWRSIKAAGSINTVTGSSTGVVNVSVATSGDTVTISTALDSTVAAGQFLGGPAGAGGTVGYRNIVGTDLPVPTTTTRGGVVVNGQGLRMDGNVIEVANDVTANATHGVVTHDAKGLITGSRSITAADLPNATSSTRGAVIPGTGLSVSSGTLNHTNVVVAGTGAKVSFDAQGHVTATSALADTDIPNIPATKLTSGTLDMARIGTNAVTGIKLANSSTVKFGGAGSTAGIVTFPTPDFQGQYFFDALNGDLYLYDGSAWRPITITAGELIYAGTYNAATNQVKSVTAAGTAAGFVINAALPPASTGNLRYYVVVSDSGTGTAPAPAVALAPPDMIVSGGTTWELIDVSNGIAGQLASNISFTPYGGIAATNVQTALQELEDDKLDKAGGTITGTLEIGTTGSLVFEGSSADANETTLTVVNPTADRTITLPNVTGTVITTGDSATVTNTMLAGSIADTKLLTISTADKVSLSAINIDGGTDLGAALADTDLFIVDDNGAGVNRKAAATRITDYAFGKVSGDITITSAGDAQLGAGVIVNADVNASAGIAGTKISPNFGSQTVTTTGVFSVDAGTAALPSVAVTGDLNTGLYSPGADQLAISTGGTARLFVNSTGLIGISEPTPLENLHIAAVNPGLLLEDTSGGVDEKYWRVRTVGSILRFEGVNDAFSASTSWLNVTRSAGTRFVDNIAFITGGSTERARIDSSGRLLLGTSAALANTYITATAIAPALQVEGNTGSTSTLSITRQTGAAGNLLLQRGVTGTPVTDGMALGQLVYNGFDGTNYRNAALIRGEVDGVVGTDDMPGRLVFSTTADGAATSTERLRITSTGKIGLNTTAPAALAHVGGNTIVSNVDVANATYDSVSFSVAVEELSPSGLFFSPDGRKMFVIGSTGDDVNEYTLSTPWVVSSATYVTVFSVAGQDIAPQGISFRADGRKMYMIGSTNDAVYQYTLSTPWSIATASYDSVSFSVAAQDITPTGIRFKPDGLALYVAANTGDNVYRYNLSTAWDISTATLANSFNFTAQEALVNDLAFTADGSRMFIVGTSGDDVNIYNLTTPWDITTASFVTVFSVATQEDGPTGIYVKPDGTKFYIVGITNDTVYQYTIPSAQIDLTGTTNLNGDARVGQNLTVDGRIIGSGQLVLATTDIGSASTERLRIASDGKVGIGTSSAETLLHLASATGTATPTPTELRIATTSNASDWSTTAPWGRISFYSADISNSGPKAHATIDAISQGTAGGHSALRFAISDLTTTLYEGMRFECTGTTGQTFTSFSTSGSERARIDSSGRLLVGTSTAYGGAAITSQVQVLGTTTGGSSLSLTHLANNAVSASLVLAKSRGTDAATINTIVANNDQLGAIQFVGADGADRNTISASIVAQVDAAPSAGIVPGRLIFSTGSTAGVSTERMRIDSAGRVAIGTNTAIVDKFTLFEGDLSFRSRTSSLGRGAEYKLLRNDEGSTNGMAAIGMNGAGTNGYQGEIKFYTGASDVFNAALTERARIDSSGKLLLGSSSSYSISAVNEQVQLHSTGGGASSIGLGSWSTASASTAPGVTLFRSRGAVGTFTTVAAGDTVGVIRFQAADGTSSVQAATIDCLVDGTPGAGSMPGRISFQTTPSGSNAAVEVMRITSDKVIARFQTAPASVNTTATLTNTQLKEGLITSSTAAAVTMTLPTGTDMDLGFSGPINNMSIEWSVINTGATNAVTVQANTNHTIVGSANVAASTSARYRSRRTTTNTWVSYRLA